MHSELIAQILLINPLDELLFLAGQLAAKDVGHNQAGLLLPLRELIAEERLPRHVLQLLKLQFGQLVALLRLDVLQELGCWIYLPGLLGAQRRELFLDREAAGLRGRRRQELGWLR